MLWKFLFWVLRRVHEGFYGFRLVTRPEGLHQGAVALPVVILFWLFIEREILRD